MGLSNTQPVAGIGWPGNDARLRVVLRVRPDTFLRGRQRLTILASMGVWVVVVVAGMVAVGLLWRRAHGQSISSDFDAGTVSESWLREHRADKQDPFSS